MNFTRVKHFLFKYSHTLCLFGGVACLLYGIGHLVNQYASILGLGIFLIWIAIQLDKEGG